VSITTVKDRADLGRRAAAYGRVMRRLDSMPEELLHGDERDLVRHACDALFFGDEDAREQALEVRRLARALVGEDRLTAARARRLVADVEACGRSSRLLV
jgi:hypothetical protein